jgi:CheY-like chemotaxis protein
MKTSNPPHKTIMLVDDDTDDLEYLHEVINEIDPTIQCVFASNGVDALKKLRFEGVKPPDIIFLDLNMPYMDGRSCLMEIKKEEGLKDIPVIMISTSSYPKDIEEAHKLGAAYYLTKNIPMDNFYKELIFILKSDWLISKFDSTLQERN